MSFFAIALMPEGNVRRIIRETIRALPGHDMFDLRAGLPEALYLGFYEKVGKKTIVHDFLREAALLFAHLPATLTFSGIVRRGGDYFIAPGESLDPCVKDAESLAAKLGLSPREPPFFFPGAGFFCGADVTSVEAGTFSFRHLDAVLLKVRTHQPLSRDASPDGSEALSWTLLARIPRRTGPNRSRTPRAVL